MFPVFSPRHQESAAFMQRLSSAREALAEKIREARSENEEWRGVEQNPNIIDIYQHTRMKEIAQCITVQSGQPHEPSGAHMDQT